MTAAIPVTPLTGDYTEVRRHEMRKSRMVFVDGNLSTNQASTEAGTSARVYEKGYWGFASVATLDNASEAKVQDRAMANARVMSRFGKQQTLQLPVASHRGEHVFKGADPLSQKDCMELLHNLHTLCKSKYPDLLSTSFMLQNEHHSKHLATSNGSQVLNSIQRAVCYLFLTAANKDGNPVRLVETVSGKGSLADLDLSMSSMETKIDNLYRHLQAKCEAVPARGGKHTIVLAPELAGMLAHEAMGHPCEADLVLGGAVTGDLLGQQIASKLITMVDFAHHYGDEEVMIPVYADDEGTPATDAILIQDGVLQQFMNSRETASQTGKQPTGNARAYQYSDEPLVRMRNTAILPGKDKLSDMIAGVEDGYFLMQTGNGQADSTTEFMFGINLGYEIRNGQLGRAIRDTTISGNAIEMLSSIDAVSDDMHWVCSGYCGKKQPMVVSMGGPALRGVAHLGGE